MTPGSGSSTTYSEDASGNLTTLPDSSTTTHDYGSELTSSTVSGTTTDYSYDAAGNRTQATVSGSTTVSASYSGADELTTYDDSAADMTAATYNGDGFRTSDSTTPTGGSSTTEDFVWNMATSVPEILMDSDNAYLYAASGTPFEQVGLGSGTVQYLASDALGSVRGVVSSIGGLTVSTSYDAWGNPETTGGLTADTPFGYAGGYTDPTGLIYLIHRYYDPATGQFLNIDPLVNRTNAPYFYGGDDPVNETDPSGRLGINIPGIGCLGNCGPSTSPGEFTCGQPSSGTILSAYTPGAISCDSGALVPGSLRSGSTAGQARAAAEADGYDIPPNYVAEPQANGQGWVFRAPGSSGNSNIIRVSEPNAQNPNGYVRYYNSSGQPLNIDGNPGPDSDTHLPLSPDDPENGDEPSEAWWWIFELGYAVSPCLQVVPT
jgi:RHS repeat-associated protein